MAFRFNPPPGWPIPQPGWAPPHGWQPDPSWPPPPPGWNLWVDDAPAVGPPQVTAAQAGWAQSFPPAAPHGFPPVPQVVPFPRAVPSFWKWAVGGAAAVFLGSLLPFISYSGLGGGDVRPGARMVSAVFGAVLGLLAVASRTQLRSRVCNGLLLPGGILGTLGYGGFILLGLVGFQDDDSSFFADTSTKIHFDPNIGVTCCLAGCVIVVVAAVQGLRGR